MIQHPPAWSQSSQGAHYAWKDPSGSCSPPAREREDDTSASNPIRLLTMYSWQEGGGQALASPVTPTRRNAWALKRHVEEQTLSNNNTPEVRLTQPTSRLRLTQPASVQVRLRLTQPASVLKEVTADTCRPGCHHQFDHTSCAPSAVLFLLQPRPNGAMAPRRPPRAALRRPPPTLEEASA